MYAVIRSGGKMFKVEEGQSLKVEKLEAETGSEITLDDVLMVRNGDDVKVGTPMLDGSHVTAEVVSHGKHKKIRVIKFKRRKDYRRTQGHRQQFTELKINKISC